MWGWSEAAGGANICERQLPCLATQVTIAVAKATEAAKGQSRGQSQLGPFSAASKKGVSENGSPQIVGLL